MPYSGPVPRTKQANVLMIVNVSLNVRIILNAFQLRPCRDVSGCLWHSLVVPVLLDFWQEFSRVLHTFGTDTSNWEERRCVSRDAVPLAADNDFAG
jgi:hypothetical protein